MMKLHTCIKIAKDKKIRKLVHNFQINCAYRSPKSLMVVVWMVEILHIK